MLQKRHHFPTLETNPIEDRDLILLAGKRLLKKTPASAWARSMGRFGFSGSRLYITRFSLDKARAPATVLPFAVKIGLADKIRIEHDKYRRLVEFHRFRSELVLPASGSPFAAILFDFEGGQDGSVVELRDILFSEARQESSHEFLIPDVLKTLYHTTLKLLHADERRVENVKLGSLFDLDAVSADIAFARVKELLDGMNYAITDDRELYETIFDEFATVLLGRIHGDLHPSNVVVSKNGRVPVVSAIDWANYESKGFLLRDFVLMECSIRFHRFPYDISLPTQQKFDALLARSWTAIELSSEFKSSRHYISYSSLAEAVVAIRSSAESAYSRKGCALLSIEYKKALFLQLVRQLRYYTYCHSAAIGLVELGKYLRESDRLVN